MPFPRAVVGCEPQRSRVLFYTLARHTQGSQSLSRHQLSGGDVCPTRFPFCLWGLRGLVLATTAVARRSSLQMPEVASAMFQKFKYLAHPHPEQPSLCEHMAQEFITDEFRGERHLKYAKRSETRAGPGSLLFLPFFFSFSHSGSTYLSALPQQSYSR